MLQILTDTLRLTLPALIPSWRFFKAVQPSPRIEWRSPDLDEHWQAFRPRPTHLSPITILQRMIWNPRWNETLFMVSCSERLTAEVTDHSIGEILKPLRQDMPHKATTLQFRLKFIDRIDGTLQEQITFTSGIYPAQHKGRDNDI
ncbi:hypothetical protein [Halocynthiibacter styelae]|uniref:Uncharacterized protein n=1 Tax=Halocynthiibacter styelae TaxID=2761955 RepID=A0A8J7LK90_9RHOB|nr:hypothetical protein [Paenihalocynthiibacter styelae]MBI1492054.1 hypothetical protein [Paenihalocynthiibacter styelae]